MKKWNIWEIEVKTNAHRLRMQTYSSKESAYRFAFNLFEANTFNAAKGKETEKKYIVEETIQVSSTITKGGLVRIDYEVINHQKERYSFIQKDFTLNQHNLEYY